MAFFRARFSIVARSQGGSAGARSAYQNCLDHGDNKWSEKSAEFVHSEVMLPELAPEDFADPAILWEAVEAGEKRKDAQISRTFDIAIPHEVPEDLRNDFARDILRPYVDDHAFALEWTRHKADHLFSDEDRKILDALPDDIRKEVAPSVDEITLNDHIHVQMTMRPLGPEGFGKKDREFNKQMMARNGRNEREAIASRMNAFFDRHGIATRVLAGPKADDELRLPNAKKPVIAMFKRWQMTALKASAQGRATPAQPRPVRAFLQERRQAVATLLTQRGLGAQIARLERQQAAPKKENKMKPNKEHTHGNIHEVKAHPSRPEVPRSARPDQSGRRHHEISESGHRMDSRATRIPEPRGPGRPGRDRPVVPASQKHGAGSQHAHRSREQHAQRPAAHDGATKRDDHAPEINRQRIRTDLKKQRLRNAIRRDSGPVIDLGVVARNASILTDDSGKLRSSKKGNHEINSRIIKPEPFASQDTRTFGTLTGNITNTLKDTMDTIKSRIQGFAKEHGFGLQKAYSDRHQALAGPRRQGADQQYQAGPASTAQAGHDAGNVSSYVDQFSDGAAALKAASQSLKM